MSLKQLKSTTLYCNILKSLLFQPFVMNLNVQQSLYLLCIMLTVLWFTPVRPAKNNVGNSIIYNSLIWCDQSMISISDMKKMLGGEAKHNLMVTWKIWIYFYKINKFFAYNLEKINWRSDLVSVRARFEFNYYNFCWLDMK
jgi:hypothetical protein